MSPSAIPHEFSLRESLAIRFAGYLIHDGTPLSIVSRMLVADLAFYVEECRMGGRETGLSPEVEAIIFEAASPADSVGESYISRHKTGGATRPAADRPDEPVVRMAATTSVQSRPIGE